MVAAVMVVMVVVVVGSVMVVGGGWGLAIGLTGASAFPLAERAALHRALHMVMMAVLGKAHFSLKPKHLRPVFAEGAIHGVAAFQHFHLLTVDFEFNHGFGVLCPA